MKYVATDYIALWPTYAHNSSSTKSLWIYNWIYNIVYVFSSSNVLPGYQTFVIWELVG